MAEPSLGGAVDGVDSEAEAKAQQGLLEGITAVCEVDVLCGRGGAALRHPGNQTYRRLVNLNKGLYITCLKTEKLKISRSIVAAIREQKGRFLEKDNKNGSWYDIGDKKAIEKTSQALREGQPKLRQKIVEMGGGSVGAVSLMESNFGPTAATLFAAASDAEYVSVASNNNGAVLLDGNSMNAMSNNNNNMPPPQDMAAMAAAMRSMQPSQQHQQLHNPQHRHHHHQQLQQQQQQQHLRHPGQPASFAGDDFLQHADSLQNLSLHDMSEPHQHQHRSTLSSSQQQQQQQYNNSLHHNNSTSFRQRILRPSLTGRMNVPQELGMQHQDSQLSLMSDFSSFGHSGHNLHSGVNESLISLGVNNDSYRGGGGGGGQHRGSPIMMHASAQLPLASSTSSSMAPHNQGELFSKDQGSAVNSRQGIPNDYQQQQLNMASTTSGGHQHGRDNMNSLRKSDSTAPTSNRSSSAVTAEDIDRRRVFAKMKYSRPPSDRSQHNTSSTAQHRPASQQQQLQQQQYYPQQQQPNLPHASQHSLGDGMPDIYMVESSLSLHSNMSAMTDGNSKKHLGSSSHHNNMLGSGSNHHMTGSSSHMPGGSGTTAGAQLPAGVELGKVVDHSSRGMDSGSSHNYFAEMLGSGSKHSIMSGLSRISDTSLNDADGAGGSSIFSDLSKKIGNVSTRSMAMSEISGIDLMREREDEDNYDDDDDDDENNVDDDDSQHTQDFAGEN